MPDCRVLMYCVCGRSNVVIHHTNACTHITAVRAWIILNIACQIFCIHAIAVRNGDPPPPVLLPWLLYCGVCLYAWQLVVFIV